MFTEFIKENIFGKKQISFESSPLSSSFTGLSFFGISGSKILGSSSFTISGRSFELDAGSFSDEESGCRVVVF